VSSGSRNAQTKHFCRSPLDLTSIMVKVNEIEFQGLKEFIDHFEPETLFKMRQQYNILFRHCQEKN